MLDDWRIYALASAFFAGLTALAAKVGVAGIPSNTATLIRAIIIVGFLSILVFVRREWVDPFSLNRMNLLFLLLSGLATGLSWLFYFRALQLGPASMVVSVDRLSFLFAIFLSVLFLGERLSPFHWVGVALMCAGALIIVLK